MAWVVLYVAHSLDGFIATPDGGVGWLDKYNAPDGADKDSYGYIEFLRSVDCLVMGSRTYQQVIDSRDWPYGTKPVYVFSRRELPKASESVVIFDRSIAAFKTEVAPLYNRIWLVGGGMLAQVFMENSLIDEMILFVVPVALGSGIRLFQESAIGSDWKLLGHRSYANGMVELRYERAL